MEWHYDQRINAGRFDETIAERENPKMGEGMKIRDCIFYTISFIAILLMTAGAAFNENKFMAGGFGLLFISFFMLYGLLSDKDWWGK